jgi:hypothetical protein
MSALSSIQCRVERTDFHAGHASAGKARQRAAISFFILSFKQFARSSILGHHGKKVVPHPFAF